MSADSVAEVAAVCCASCGKTEVDEVKLRQCDKCDLARYCSDECEDEHRQTHEVNCGLRAAELRDEVLFRQPESSHLGDCPICFLPIPLGGKSFYSCCYKRICKGCGFTNQIREIEQQLNERCPFCRKLVPETKEECRKNVMKRAATNDPGALRQMGWYHHNEGDYDAAFQHLARAAALGDVEGHFELSVLYRKGLGVEKDEEMETYHLEEAAVGGRYNLGWNDWEKERHDKAVKHWIIAANLGDNKSLRRLKECYKDGHVSKDNYAAALRAHQAAVDATKSPQREEAAKFQQISAFFST